MSMLFRDIDGNNQRKHLNEVNVVASKKETGEGEDVFFIVIGLVVLLSDSLNYVHI